LSKIVLGLDIEMEMDSQEISESERNLTLSASNIDSVLGNIDFQGLDASRGRDGEQSVHTKARPRYVQANPLVEF
jgi:hypothetical protein